MGIWCRLDKKLIQDHDKVCSMWWPPCPTNPFVPKMMVMMILNRRGCAQKEKKWKVKYVLKEGFVPMKLFKLVIVAIFSFAFPSVNPMWCTQISLKWYWNAVCCVVTFWHDVSLAAKSYWGTSHADVIHLHLEQPGSGIRAFPHFNSGICLVNFGQHVPIHPFLSPGPFSGEIA